eukprot:CAMPEP_0115863990 /NCGR_PEP_ID=MMETSP0287-20121206/18968_1 /TAXON_ID=412157 /ORGANISM="Chrysochromulina rotalis, Strain UIO044" /LENGTH=57 /DNA_ID=CAMNT_0003318443 /DNA_START=606 /DNA_END=776 /DNA_ORIENTATION=+
MSGGVHLEAKRRRAKHHPNFRACRVDSGLGGDLQLTVEPLEPPHVCNKRQSKAKAEL